MQIEHFALAMVSLNFTKIRQLYEAVALSQEPILLK
jgi:hypothetical protein